MLVSFDMKFIRPGQTRSSVIGVGRFRILGGGQGLEFDVVTTSMRRNDVASTSFRRRVPIIFLIYQCQIITFLILKYDIIENSRIELRGIVLPVQMDGLLGGAKGYVAPPPLSNYWGGGPPPPLAPSSYAYERRYSEGCAESVQHVSGRA